LTVEFVFYIVDAVSQTIFSQTSVQFKGVGQSEEKALIQVIKNINPKMGQFKGFVEKGKEKIVEYANKKITKEQLIPKLYIDLLLDSEDISYKLIEELNNLEPFGYGNLKPTIALSNLIITKKSVMGKENNHMKLLVKGNGIDLLTLIMFGCNEDTETLKENDEIDVVGYPDINVWNGNQSIQFGVKEWKYSDKN